MTKSFYIKIDFRVDTLVLSLPKDTVVSVRYINQRAGGGGVRTCSVVDSLALGFSLLPTALPA